MGNKAVRPAREPSLGLGSPARRGRAATANSLTALNLVCIETLSSEPMRLMYTDRLRRSRRRWQTFVPG